MAERRGRWRAAFTVLVSLVALLGAVFDHAGAWLQAPPRPCRTRLTAKVGDKERPVVAVLGAGGRTGALVVEALLKDGIATPRALTRSGSWSPVSPGVSAEGVEVGTADVTDASSLSAALAGASAVVFAAAYAKDKSTPEDVDNAGLVNTGRAVLEQGVRRLIVVSSIAVTRWYSPVGFLLNTVGSGVLNEKLKGEEEIKQMFAKKKSTYTIVRPGGLRDEPAVGVENIEFNQGDHLVANVARADVAAVCATAATAPKNPGAGKTFEMYKGADRRGLMPWYGEKLRYCVRGDDCADMIRRLRPDDEVYDVPGMLPWQEGDWEGRYY